MTPPPMRLNHGIALPITISRPPRAIVVAKPAVIPFAGVNRYASTTIASAMGTNQRIGKPRVEFMSDARSPSWVSTSDSVGRVDVNELS